MDDRLLVQGTDEWKMARVGSLGASRIHEAVAKTKSGWSASRANLMALLITERLTGLPQDTYQNAAMLHGIETEGQARIAYEFRTNADVRSVGVIRHPAIAGTHASPDGLVGDVGLVEIKCPTSSTHIETLLGQSIPGKYEAQMQWQMACTGAKWCDFVSFDPRLPEKMRLFVSRLQRDDKRIKELETEIVAFLGELDAKVKALTDIYEKDKAA